jgi:hypothetical protein
MLEGLKMSDEGSDYLIADQSLETLINSYRAQDANIKQLMEAKDVLRKDIEARVGDKSAVFDENGLLLLTYKRGENRITFDAKWLKEKMPDVYEQFLVESPGNRTFLLKKVD